MEIKICGMASEPNIREIAGLRPDYIGLIFHAPSPRNAIGLSLGFGTADGVRKGLVGVFVDKTEDEIMDYARQYKLSTVQLHGDESPELCRALRLRGLKVWKAVGLETVGDFETLTPYADCVDRFVFDSKSPARGGSGLKFDWNLLRFYTFPVDFMLGGGIGPDDAEAIAALSHPRLAGLDLNSRFEVIPGVKNSNLLKSFINKIRSL